MKIINKTIEVTNGYKTKAAAVVYLVVMLFGNNVPFIVDHQDTINTTLNVLISSGILHDVYRNRKKVWEWITGVFSKNNN